MSQDSTTAERIGALRGAGVAEVDRRRLGAAAALVCALALAVVSSSLFVAGAHKNAQIASLRARGVPVTVTVTRCTGLLGGSGSNPVGYACRGTYTFGGQRYREAIPGTALRSPGSTMTVIADPADPGLIATAAEISAEHPSARVFVLPGVLLAALGALVAALGVAWRRSRRVPSAPSGGRVAAAAS